jgi:hypothetical protein
VTELDVRVVDATHMNRLDENVSASKQKKISKTISTYSHPTGVTEQDVVVLSGIDEEMEIVFDCVNLLQATTIRIYEKTDGINYRLNQSAVYPTEFVDKNVLIKINGKGMDAKITFQSAVAEGSSKNVPWARVDELRA